MARSARAVAPDYPHHVIQRGNRRQQTFFNDEDYRSYLVLMAEWCAKYHVDMGLLSDAEPTDRFSETKEGLNAAIGEAHRRYTRRINFREGWRGHLWQGRFSSFIMENNTCLLAKGM